MEIIFYAFWCLRQNDVHSFLHEDVFFRLFHLVIDCAGFCKLGSFLYAVGILQRRVNKEVCACQFSSTLYKQKVYLPSGHSISILSIIISFHI